MLGPKRELTFWQKQVPTAAPAGVATEWTDSHETRGDLFKDRWEHWEVPFEADPVWPSDLKDSLKDYRKCWRLKMEEVNACIAANAEHEALVDRPQAIAGVVRVSGPFTVESVHPLEESLGVESPIAGGPEDLDSFEPDADFINTDATSNSEAFHDTLIRLLRNDGVRFPWQRCCWFRMARTSCRGERVARRR